MAATKYLYTITSTNGIITSVGFQFITSDDVTGALGFTPGTGTVTSVATGDGLTGGPVTTTGTLSVLTQMSVAVDASGVRLAGDSATPGNSKYYGTDAGGTLGYHAVSGLGGGTVTSVDLTAPAAGITVSGGPVTTSGSITLALANDLSALEGLSGTGYASRTGTDTWTLSATIPNADVAGLGSLALLSAAPAGTLTGATLAAGVTASSLTSFGTSPALTGTPTAPTAAAGTNTTQIATTAFVTSAVATAVTGYLDFKGSTDASTSPNYPAAVKGDLYVVSVAGRVGGAGGISVDVGDVYLATADNAGGTQAAVGSSWTVLEHNLVGALLSANNLSDVANAATARTNLGLGMLATLSSVDLSGSQASGTLAAARFPALTGDVTTTAGALATTIAAGAVTNAKAAQMAANTLKGNNTAGTATAADLTAAQTKTLLSLDAVENTALSTWAGSGSLTQTGTLTGGGAWQQTTIALLYGGTGSTSAAAARAGLTGLNVESGTPHGDSAYTILITDRFLYTNAALTAARTWTLPAANAVNAGGWVWVADLAGGVTAANTLTVQRAGTDTINGGTSVVLTEARGVILLQSDGVSKWSARLLTGTNTGTNTGDQTITLTGNVTGSGTGSFAATIPALTVTNTMLAGSIAFSKLIGSDITGTGTLVAGGTGAGFTVALGTSTITGILSAANGGTGNGFTAFTGPATSTKTFTLPNATCTILTTNAAVTEAQGGTNQATYTLGDTLYSSAANTLAKLAGNTTATKKYLSQTGTGSVSAAPAWSQPAFSELSGSVDLSGSQASGTLAAARFPALTGDATTAAGSLATTVVSAGDSAAGKIQVAVKTDQTTATSATTAVTPGRQQYHPSASKAWVYFTVSGTTVTVQASYNVSSVTRNGVGDYTINFTTAFASANYAGTVTCGLNTAGTFYTVGAYVSQTTGGYRFTTVQMNNAVGECSAVHAHFNGAQ